MSKPKKALNVRLPAYRYPRNAWRQQIRQALRDAQERAGVTYGKADRLALTARLYMGRAELAKHDLDNRLKDIMDALQTRIGGPKRTRRKHRLVPNDHQVWRVRIEKLLSPKQAGGLGHLSIRAIRTER